MASKSPRVTFLQTGVHIAANGKNAHIRPQDAELRSTARRTGADDRAAFQIGEPLADDYVKRIGALGDRRNAEARGRFGG